MAQVRPSRPLPMGLPVRRGPFGIWLMTAIFVGATAWNFAELTGIPTCNPFVGDYASRLWKSGMAGFYIVMIAGGFLIPSALWFWLVGRRESVGRGAAVGALIGFLVFFLPLQILVFVCRSTPGRELGALADGLVILFLMAETVVATLVGLGAGALAVLLDKRPARRGAARSPVAQF